MTASEVRWERARLGLQAWSGFPSDRKPRPLVLLFPAVRPGGFPDAQKKMAFYRGAIDAVPGFPKPLLRALQKPDSDYGGPPLLVTTATLASTEYRTDRGRMRLAAWRVRARDVPEPIWVLDPSVSQQIWQPPYPYALDWPGSTAVLGADGQTLEITFTGSPYADYQGADILQSGGAVAAVPRPEFSNTSGPARSLPAVGQARRITVTLPDALGDRVLLDSAGWPVMVTA